MKKKPEILPDNNIGRWLAPFLVAAAAFAVFLPALHNGFVNWDDLGTLTENQRYRGLGWPQLKWMLTTFHMGLYQPLSWFSYAVDYRVWGMAPYGYHLTNIILHSADALVLYFLCAKLLVSDPALPDHEPDLKVIISAAFAALFFAVHPLRVESVAWATERRDVLSGLFYLLSIFWYVSARAPGAGRRSLPRRQLLPLAAFLLALFSKAITVTLPATLVILDIYPLRRLPLQPGKWFSSETKAVWLEKLPFAALSLVFAAAGYAAQGTALRSYQDFGAGDRALHSLFSILFYVWKTLVPLHLSPLYQLPAGAGFIYLLGGMLLAVITAVLFFLYRDWPAGLAVWLAYLAALVPVMGIVKFGAQAAADRYTYLPCLPFAVLAGGGLLNILRDGGRKIRRASVALAAAALLFLAWQTAGQIKVWRDSETLWSRALALDPEIDLAHNNLGSDLFARGKTDEAIAQFAEALRLKPDYPGAHYNLGKAFEEKGRPDLAGAQYLETLRLDPGFAQAAYNLGILLDKQGKAGQALYYYAAALKANPEFAEAHYNTGTIYAGHGDLPQATAQYLEALRIKPDYVDAHTNLCALLAAQGKLEEGIAHCAQALRLAPDNVKAHYDLALALASRGEATEAVRHYLRALELSPDFAEAHYNLSVLLAAGGDRAQAQAHYRRAISLKPSLPRRKL